MKSYIYKLIDGKHIILFSIPVMVIPNIPKQSSKMNIFWLLRINIVMQYHINLKNYQLLAHAMNKNSYLVHE